MYPNYNMYNPYYGFNEYNYRSSEPINRYNEEIITLNQAIELIRTSIGDEREDEIFYDNLIEQAPTEKDKEIIISIRDDERKHNQILRELYYNFTGQVIPVDTSSIANIENKLNYKEQLEKALFGELNAVVKYRKIMGTMPSGNSYTLLMSIMTDELRHASKYNFLIHNAK
jgi:rubrerythrin